MTNALTMDGVKVDEESPEAKTVRIFNRCVVIEKTAANGWMVAGVVTWVLVQGTGPHLGVIAGELLLLWLVGCLWVALHFKRFPFHWPEANPWIESPDVLKKLLLERFTVEPRRDQMRKACESLTMCLWAYAVCGDRATLSSALAGLVTVVLFFVQEPPPLTLVRKTTGEIFP